MRRLRWVLVGFLVVAAMSPVGATYVVIQTNSCDETTDDPAECAFGSNVNAGSLLVAFLTYPDGTITTSTPTDTLGNTYVLVHTHEHASANNRVYMYCTISGSGGANTVSFNLSAASTTTHVGILEASGPKGSGWTCEDENDDHGETTNATSHALQATLTANQANDLIVSGIRFGTAFNVDVPPSGYTQFTNAPLSRGTFFYKVSTDSSNENPTYGTDANETAVTVASRFATDAGAAATTLRGLLGVGR
jgi:hypothetical protein